MFIRLEDNEKTDLLANFDPIMAALNFVRYVALMQSNGAFDMPTRLWTYVNDQFLAPLERGIELSRAHHELDLKKTTEEDITKSKEKLKKTSWERLRGKEKITVMKTAICSLDMMASVVFRVKEVIASILTV